MHHTYVSPDRVTSAWKRRKDCEQDSLSSNGIIKIAKCEILRRLIEIESDFLDEEVLRARASDGGAEELPVGLF